LDFPERAGWRSKPRSPVWEALCSCSHLKEILCAQM